MMDGNYSSRMCDMVAISGLQQFWFVCTLPLAWSPRIKNNAFGGRWISRTYLDAIPISGC